MPLTCITRHAARSEQSRPIRPSSAAGAQTPLARRGAAQVSKIGERGERARHTPSQRIVAEVAAHPKRIRPLGGTTPHPRQPCASCGTRAPYPWDGVPLEYSSVTSRARVISESTATSPAAAPPLLDAPDMHPPTCRALGAEPTDPTLLGRTRASAGGRKGGSTGVQDW
jgi:hypothetical protein